MKDKKTIIFIGNSGCGKGTQADLIEKKLKKKGEKVFHLEIGDEFRDLLNMTTYTAELARGVSERGELQPEFLAIKMWANLFNLYYSPDKNVIIDGSPRKLEEAKILHQALKFYEIKNASVVYVKIPREVAKERMLSRGRKDDTEEKIEGRLDWFESEVMESIEFFRDHRFYEFIEVDGEESIEKINKKIEKELGI